MALTRPSQVKLVHGISSAERSRIRDFLQGAVYCWCGTHGKRWFALRDLMGGPNFYWRGTPMIVLWDKHNIPGARDPVKAAGIDGGWLLKRVIVDDRRLFESEVRDLVRHYRWTGDDGHVET